MQNNLEINEDLIRKIYELAVEAIEEAQKVKDKFIGDPINWGDLWIDSVQLVVEYLPTHSGTVVRWEYYRVIFGEAASDSWRLQNFIEEYIKKRIDEDIVIEVLSEW